MSPRCFAVLVSILAASAASAADKIVIGATVPLTGQEAKSGKQFKDGYDLAFALANEAGGLRIGGRRIPVELRALDDGSSPEESAKLTSQMIEKEGLHLMLGSFSTRIVEKQSEVTEQHRVPLVMGSGAATALFRRGFKYLYGLQAPVEQLAYAELRWIDAQQKDGNLPKPLRVAVAVEDTSHGKDFREGVMDFVGKTASRKADYQVVLDAKFALDQKSYKQVLDKLEAARADVFLADAHLTDFITMHREYRRMGMCHSVISYGARGTEKKGADALGAKAIEHVTSGVWWSPLLTSNAESKKFIDAFQKRYGRAPEWYEALSYESARVLFAAIEEAGNTDSEYVKHALDHVEIPSLLPGGKLSFPSDTGHQTRALYVVLQNAPDGSISVIYPRDLVTHPGTLAHCQVEHASR